jgi:hypothetical protein
MQRELARTQTRKCILDFPAKNWMPIKAPRMRGFALQKLILLVFTISLAKFAAPAMENGTGKLIAILSTVELSQSASPPLLHQNEFLGGIDRPDGANYSPKRKIVAKSKYFVVIFRHASKHEFDQCSRTGFGHAGI